MEQEEQVDFTPRPTFNVSLTKNELVHLRDLFNIMLPPTMQKTVSQSLAEGCNRPLVEAKLWLKVAETCEEANLPLDDEAPDFTLALTSSPAIGVFELQHDPNQQREDDDEEEPSGPFAAGGCCGGCSGSCGGCEEDKDEEK